MSTARILQILALGCCILTWGCRRSQTAPSPEAVHKSRPAVDRTAEVEERHRWNLQTLVGDYDRAGKKSPKWDEDARQALSLFAKVRARSTVGALADLGLEVSNHVARAMNAGCDDPLILYLAARYVYPSDREQENEDLKNPIRPFAAAAEGILERDYSPVRKYYASLRASEWFLRNIHDGHISSEAGRYRELSVSHLSAVIADENTPGVEAAEALEQFVISPKTVPKWRHKIVEQLEPVLLKNWPDEPEVYLVLGRYYRTFAWAARGNGFSGSVTAEGWKLFGERLLKAEQLLTRGWELDGSDSRIPIELINVELGQGKGRKVMESWFQRAMAADTNSYQACQDKLYYLEPKWYGSEDEMLAFGRECLASKAWGWSVPLILADAHRRIANYRDGDAARAYWRQAEVWKDIRECFEKFFALYPDAIGWRHNYAWFAYRCEQWQEAKNQIQMMGPVNYQYFGGRDAYDRMVEEVEQHTRGSNR